MVNIVITEIGDSFHAPDTTVSKDDVVQISTSVSGTNFKVVVPNSDGFFDSTSDAIVGTVSQSNSLSLGTVTGIGKTTKYYAIDPSIEAPPRIIRITSTT